MKTPTTETVFEVWVNRAIGGRHQKATTEAEAWALADSLAGEPNVEVLKVTTTRKPVKRSE